MFVKFLGVKGTWREIADAANTTIGKEAGTKEPSSLWKRRMLLCEHSPIRKLVIMAKWHDLKSWVSVHLVRHWLGIIHFVRTQRTDKTGINRDDLPQGSFVKHEIEANSQAIINISRRRLCKNASPETTEAWQEFINSFKDEQPELRSVCVPNCIYQGWCYEFKSCGYHKTKEYQDRLRMHRNYIND